MEEVPKRESLKHASTGEMFQHHSTEWNSKHVCQAGKTTHPIFIHQLTPVSQVMGPLPSTLALQHQYLMLKMVKASHARFRALGPVLIPVYRQSARR